MTRFNVEDFEKQEQEWMKKFQDLNDEFCRLKEEYESIKERPYSEVRPVIDNMIKLADKVNKLDTEHKKFLTNYVDLAIDEASELIRKMYREKIRRQEGV